MLLGMQDALHRVSRQESAIASLTSRIDKLSEIVTLSAQHGVGVNHTDIRIFALKSQIAQASDDPVVIVGDSITEGALVPSKVCDKTVINAGVGGTDIQSYVAIAKEIFDNKSAALIIIALGTNDSIRSTSPTDAFVASYAVLADALSPHAKRIMFAGIPAINMTGALASQYFDSNAVDRHNEEVMQLAKQRSTPFINLRSNVESDITVDGVHLNAAGYKSWIFAITSAIDGAFGCNTTAIR